MIQAWPFAFGDHQIDGFSAYELDVGAGCVEMSVVGNDVAVPAHDAEQNALGGSPLVSGDDVTIAEDVLNRVAEMIEAAAPGIALITLHQRRPLVGRHGAGAGVSQQIDQNVFRRQKKDVVVSCPEHLLPLSSGRPAYRFPTLDSKRLDDGFHGHRRSSP